MREASLMKCAKDAIQVNQKALVHPFFLYVESTLGEGTSFHIYLPAVDHAPLTPQEEGHKLLCFYNLN